MIRLNQHESQPEQNMGITWQFRTTMDKVNSILLLQSLTELQIESNPNTETDMPKSYADIFLE